MNQSFRDRDGVFSPFSDTDTFGAQSVWASRSRTLCVYEVGPPESWLYQLVKILKEKLASAVQDSDVLDVPGSQLPAASI